MTPRKSSGSPRPSSAAGGEPGLPPGGPSFEKSLERLQEIVRLLEDGGASLDEAVKMYEEGIQISRTCLDHLTRVETKVKRLSKDIQGNFSLAEEPDERN
jgi:exodeoxyribonuclease VII small subunit